MTKFSFLFGLLLALFSTGSFAGNSLTYQVPPAPGIVWVVLTPAPNYDYTMFKVDFCVSWGAYKKCPKVNMLFKNQNPVVIGFAHYDSNSYPMQVTTPNFWNGAYNATKVNSIIQGNTPYISPYQTTLYCNSSQVSC